MLTMRLMGGYTPKQLSDMDKPSLCSHSKPCSPVRIPGLASRDAFADDAAAGVLANVHHFGACVGLLHVVGQRYAEELPCGVVTLEDAAGVLPGDGRSRLHLQQPCQGHPTGGHQRASWSCAG